MCLNAIILIVIALKKKLKNQPPFERYKEIVIDNSSFPAQFSLQVAAFFSCLPGIFNCCWFVMIVIGLLIHSHLQFHLFSSTFYFDFPNQIDTRTIFCFSRRSSSFRCSSLTRSISFFHVAPQHCSSLRTLHPPTNTNTRAIKFRSIFGGQFDRPKTNRKSITSFHNQCNRTND